MPLEKQIVPIVFNKGMDTKSNNKVAASNDTLVDLRNAVFTTTEKVSKRNGYTALTSSILGGGSISAGVALANRGSELLMADGTNLYSYSNAPASAAWVSKGPLLSPTVRTTPLASSQYSLGGGDCAVNSAGLCCWAAEAWSPVVSTSLGGSRVGTYYGINDINSGQVLLSPVLTFGVGDGFNFKVLSVPGYFLVFQYSVTFSALYCTRISTTDFSVTNARVDDASAPFNSAYGYDAIYFNGSVYVSYLNNSTTGLVTVQYPPTTPFWANKSAAVGDATISPQGSICLVGDRFNNNVAVACTTGGGGCFYTVYSSTLGVTVKAKTALDATAATYGITGVSLSAASSSLQFFYSIMSSSAPYARDLVRQNTVTGGSYTAGTSSIFMRGATVAGRAFQLSNAGYVPLSFWPGKIASWQYGNAQSTWFLVNTAGVIVAKAYAGVFQGITGGTSITTNTSQVLPESTAFGASSFVFPAGVVTQYTANAGVTSQLTQKTELGSVTVNLSDTTNGYVATTLASSTTFAGGVVNTYDGGQNATSTLPAAVEHGFLYAPWGLSGSGAGTGLTGTYQYKACYEWTDTQGQIHRSAPSPALSVTLANQTYTLTIPTLRATQKTNAGRGGVRIVLYRTVTLGTVFYQVNNTGATNDALYNDTTVDVVTYADSLSDTLASANPQLYTTGGVLDNAAPNPLSSVVTHRNRVWGIDTTSPLSLWYSKQVTQSTNVAAGSPVEFSAFLTFNVDPKGGGCTALASLDDKLIVFKGDRIFAVTGQGPDSTGGQNDFSDALLVTGDTGCTAPKSITNVPQGVMFQGAKGIYLLDRGLNCVYIGAPVEQYMAGATVCGAQLIPTTNQVRFALSSSQYTLVYDYFVGQWSVFTVDRAQVASVVWASKYLYLGSAGVVCQESASGTNYTDPLGTVSMRVQTSWLSLAGYQGFKRLRRILIDGNAAVIGATTADGLTVSVAYNYGDNTPPTTQTASFSTNAVGTVGPLGLDGWLITTALSSTTTGDFQERIHVTQQKCESIQITINSFAGGAASSYCDITAITLEVAAKRGAFKMPAAQSTA